LLVGEQIARGEPPLTGVRGTVHIGAREELRRGALDCVGRCALAVSGRPRHHRLTCRERVLPFGQPGRARQLAAHLPQIRDLRRACRPVGERLELAQTEAVLGRPGAHDLPPRRGLDAVALALPRVVHNRLTPRAPHLDTSRDELALALLDLPATRGELPQHLRSDLLDLGHPVTNGPPAHPRQALTDRGTQVRLIQKPRRPGVPVDRRAIKRRPPTVLAPRHVRGHHVGMQLRVLRAAHPMAISGRHEPLPRLAPHTTTATTHPTRLALHVPHSGINGRLVRLNQRPRQHPITDREQHAHRLRRRERQIKRRHPRPPANPPQRLARTRIPALHQRDEALPIDHPDEPQDLPAPTRPTPRRLTAARVVVIATLRHLALVVTRLLDRQLADRQHRVRSA
jgi:hypothetical protein